MAPRAFGAFLILAHFALIPQKAAALPTLEQICGPPQNIVKGQVFTPQCQAAYGAGNASLIQNNNTYVNGAAAVVCAYSCMSGGLNSCGTGQGACSSAVSLGNIAYSDNNDSIQSYLAAQGSGTSALALAMAPPAVSIGSQGAPGSAPGASGASFGADPSVSMPAACATAASSGDPKSRIACAAATDPSLPAFVATPRFATDFEQATGFSLQDVFNKTGPALQNQYAPAALQNSFGQVRDKMSMADFLKAGSSILGGMLGNLPSEKRDGFIASVLPTALRGMIPATSTSKTTLASSTAAGSTATPPDAVNALRDPASSGGFGMQALLPGDSEEKLNLTLFQRVTLGYQRAVLTGLMRPSEFP